LHLHGSLFESRSTVDESLVYPIQGWELKLGDRCEKGSQLRPNIVWFGELVPFIEEATRLVSKADLFLVVGTSLLVYPAADLIHYAGYDVPKFLVDPKVPDVSSIANLTFIEDKASTGLEKLMSTLIELA
jgi:NAD-dependent deacetylase